MLNRRHFQGLVTGVVVLVLAGATAMASTINLPYAGTLGGKQVAAGHYTLTWEHHSPTATVTLLNGKKTLATAEGRIEERGRKFERNMVVYTRQANGDQVISEIRLGGTATAVVFEP